MAPQSIPGGLDVTVPLPTLLTVRELGAGAMGAVLLISTETLLE